jgi:hypothetical protein
MAARLFVHCHFLHVSLSSKLFFIMLLLYGISQRPFHLQLKDHLCSDVFNLLLVLGASVANFTRDFLLLSLSLSLSLSHERSLSCLLGCFTTTFALNKYVRRLVGSFSNLSRINFVSACASCSPVWLNPLESEMGFASR